MQFAGSDVGQRDARATERGGGVIGYRADRSVKRLAVQSESENRDGHQGDADSEKEKRERRRMQVLVIKTPPALGRRIAEPNFSL